MIISRRFFRRLFYIVRALRNIKTFSFSFLNFVIAKSYPVVYNKAIADKYSHVILTNREEATNELRNQ